MRQDLPQTRHWLPAVVALIALAMLVGFALRGGAQVWLGQAQQEFTCAPDAGATVCVLPSDQTVAAGANFSVEIVIDDVVNLGAYQLTLAFDAEVVAFVDALYTPFLGSTGRVPVCFSPVVADGTVRLACATTAPTDSGPPGPPGPDGSGVLATATFVALNPGTSALELSNVIIADPSGAVMAHAEQDGQVTVEPAFTPTPCDGVCPTPTPTQAPTPTPTTGPGPVIVRVDPVSQDQTTGSEFSVDIVVDNVSNLGAYEFTLAWDSGIVSFVSVSDGPFLSSTGRSVFCPEPVIGANTIRFGCVSVGSTPPGPIGSGMLARVILRAEAGSGGVPRPLDLFGTALSNPLGVPISASALDGTVTVTEVPTPTPTPCDGVCPTPTSTATPAATPTPTPTPVPVACAPGAGTRVCVQPASSDVGIGETVIVDVVVDSADHLGAYDFTMVIDPAILAFGGVTNGSFLGSTGRAVSCLTSILTIDSLRFNCVTLGPEPQGPSGTGVLASVTLLTLAPGTAPLDLQNVSLTHEDGTPFPATAQDGTVTVLTGPTPTPTVTPTPGPTFTPTPTEVPPSTITRVLPVTQTVPAGTNFTVDIAVEGVGGLASYEWELTYDPALVGYVNVTNGPFLGSTGRFVFCPPPILDTGSVRFGCVTSGTSPSPPSGAGMLSTVTLSALTPGTSPLDFLFVSLSDPLANDIPTQVFGGSVAIETPPTSTPSSEPTPTPTP